MISCSQSNSHFSKYEALSSQFKPFEVVFVVGWRYLLRIRYSTVRVNLTSYHSYSVVAGNPFRVATN